MADDQPPPADAAPASPERAAPPAEEQAVSPAGAEAGGGGSEPPSGQATEADGGSRGRERSRSQHRERSRSEGKRDRRRSGSRDRRRRDRSRSDSRRRRRERSGSRRRHRSRSRSRDRRRSRERRRRWSPSRSRSRDRRRRSSSRSRSPKRPAVAAAPLVPGALPGVAGLPGMPALAGLNPLMANPYLMPGLGGSQAVAGLSQATRRARELFVGNLPQPCADFQLQTFLNQALVALGLCKTTGKMPIIKCEMNPGGKYAFVEFSDMMDCTCALAVDGIPFMGQPLNVKRPSSYQRPYGAPPDPAPLGAAALAALLQQDGNAMAGAAVATAMAPPPGAVPGAVPAAVPAAVPGAIPGAMPAAVPGGLALPGGVQAAALDQTTRKQRELFIGNLPQPCVGTQLQQFLNQALVALGLTRSTGAMPVLKCQVSPSGAFAFVEFMDVMDCTCALALDGIPYMGQPLRIARPKEYRAPFGAPPDPAPLGAAALQTLMEQQQHQQH